MALSRWEPFHELLSLREAMDRLFEQSFVRSDRPMLASGTGGFPVDVWQTDQDVFVKATLPGVNPNDLDLNVTGDTLTIRGETKQDENVERANYLFRERRFGSFRRSFTLPASVESDKCEATFDHGELTLRLPKAQTAQPKRIRVNAGPAQLAGRQQSESGQQAGRQRSEEHG